MLRDSRQLLVLAALLVGLFAWLRADIERLDARLGARLTRIEEHRFSLPQLRPSSWRAAGLRQS